MRGMLGPAPHFQRRMGIALQPYAHLRSARARRGGRGGRPVSPPRGNPGWADERAARPGDGLCAAHLAQPQLIRFSFAGIRRVAGPMLLSPPRARLRHPQRVRHPARGAGDAGRLRRRTAPQPRQPPAHRKGLRYIRAHLAEDLSLERVCAAVFLSKSYLCQIFKSLLAAPLANT